MKCRGLLLVLFLIAGPVAATSSPQGSSPPLQGYAQLDGAIALNLDGRRIDPYFSGKALLAAHELGLDVRPAALAWIEWLLPRQLADGRFERYCRQEGRYDACAAADADDAVLAVWMELLVRFSPPAGMPGAWRDSFHRASRHLAGLRDPRRGVYWIAGNHHVALLMDNIEIYSAFQAVADYYQRRRQPELAKQWRGRARQLRRAVVTVFWSGGGFRVSTQQHLERGFYPDEVARLFPLLTDFPVPGSNQPALYAQWMDSNRGAWREQAPHDYPWGLVALVAARQQDQASVDCWRAWAAPFRHGVHWNVLEEAIFQAFDAAGPPVAALVPACGGGPPQMPAQEVRPMAEGASPALATEQSAAPGEAAPPAVKEQALPSAVPEQMTGQMP